jgi:hypothetical protein
MRRSGRATLLWAFGLFALSQAAFLVALPYWRPNMYVTISHRKWQGIRDVAAREPDRPLLVMMGSSRTDMAFDAKQFNDLRGPEGKPFVAYNFGRPAVGPIRLLLGLRQMLREGIRPRLLLVEFLPPLLNKPGRGLISEERWAPVAWGGLSELADLWPYLERPGRKAHDWAESRLAPFYSFRGHLRDCTLAHLRPERAPVRPPRHDRSGHQLPRAPGDEDPLYNGWQAFFMYHATLQRLTIGDGPRRALHDLLDLCRREDITVVLVVMPESAQFRGWYNPDGLAATRRVLDDLSAAHGAPVIDATDWLPDDHFLDGHHVTPDGARAFTARLRGELERLGVVHR